MNQKQIFTEYWKILDDVEDFMNDRFRRVRTEVPRFKICLRQPVPSDPNECRVCTDHEHNALRSPVPEQGERDVLIICRALPAVLAERGVYFSPEEESSLMKWLEAIGLDLRQNCKVVPLLFCPVKDPLHPDKKAVESCFTHIERILKETNPKTILLLGNEVGDLLAGKLQNIPVFTSPHPSDVLIDSSLKRPVWEVLKKIKGKLVGE